MLESSTDRAKELPVEGSWANVNIDAIASLSDYRQKQREFIGEDVLRRIANLNKNQKVWLCQQFLQLVPRPAYQLVLTTQLFHPWKSMRTTSINLARAFS